MQKTARTTLYHVTPQANRESILAEGLNPAYAPGRDYVWLWDDPQEMSEILVNSLTWGGDRTPDVWLVDGSGIQLQRDPHPSGWAHAFATRDAIPPDRLQLMPPERFSLARTSNIFDPIEKSLDQQVFRGIEPRQHHIDWILRLYARALMQRFGVQGDGWTDLYFTGSLTTYQYSETSDADISVFANWDRFTEELGMDVQTTRKELIAMSIDHLDGTFLPGTTHPLQFFVVPQGVLPSDLYQPGLRSAYSLDDRMWYQEPEPDRVHEIAVELPEFMARAADMAEKMTEMLDHDPESARQLWHDIHKKRQLDQQAGLGDFSEGNIVYKYLLHEGLFDRIREELGEYIAKTAISRGQAWVYDPKTDTLASGHPFHAHVLHDMGYHSGKDPALHGFIYGVVNDAGLYSVLIKTDFPTVDYRDYIPQIEVKLTELMGMPVKNRWVLEDSDRLSQRKVAALLDEETIADLTAHIYELAEKYRIEIRWGEDRHNAWAAPDLVMTPQIRYDIDYLVALHEVGHVVLQMEGQHPDWEFYDEWSEVEEEAQVWRWALDNTIIPISPEMLRQAKWDLGTYYEHATQTFGKPREPEEVGENYRWLLNFQSANLWDRVTTKVIYDFDKDQIVLGTQATLADLPHSKIIGEYADEAVTLFEAEKQWINPGYFHRLWQHTFPNRPLKDVYYRRGDNSEYKLKTRVKQWTRGDLEDGPYPWEDGDTD
jgi:hypothetical protein